MKTIRNVALAACAASAFALGSAAFADETHKPETQSKPEASSEHRGEHGRHRMNGMRDMRGGCHQHS